MTSLKQIKHRLDLDKLKKMGLLKKAADIEKKVRDIPYSLKKIFPAGAYIETPYRQVFKISHVYTGDDTIGCIRIKDFLEIKDSFSSQLSLLGKNSRLDKFKFDKLLFFDVESTGLTSGAGNMVFLIGLGFFNDDNFIVEQYFIEDYINEKGLLFILKEIFTRKMHLFSFNGKCFDFHVLKNRFVLSRKFEFTLDNMLHFDLLHTCRRMWKGFYEDYSLNSLERNILQFQRSKEDIPGFLVPEHYKRFLKTGDARILEAIFYHNLMDVRSMLGLLIIQLKNFKSVMQGQFPEKINYQNIANLLKQYNRELYCRLLEYDVLKNDKDNFEAYKQLYHFYKKQKQYQKSKEILKRCFERYNTFHYYFYKEYSIICEWHEKNYQEALDILHQAENRIQHLTKLHNFEFRKEMDDLITREGRLKKRCLKK